MLSLLTEIAGFVVGAFLLGVGVGWLFWRAGRVSMPAVTFRQREREHAHAAHAATDATARLEMARQEADRHRYEVQRTRELLHVAWAERDSFAHQLSAAESALATLARHDEAAAARVAALQRRLAEWSIGWARAQGIPPELHAPPAPVVAASVAPAVWPVIGGATVIDLTERAARVTRG